MQVHLLLLILWSMLIKRVATVHRQSQSGGVSGATMELYGGSGNEAVCNQEQLITNLHNLPGPLTAFASALGLSDGLVDDYIRSLKSETSSYESSEYTSEETAEPTSSSGPTDYPSSEPQRVDF